MYVTTRLIYPSTGSSARATIGGLPATAAPHLFGQALSFWSNSLSGLMVQVLGGTATLVFSTSGGNVLNSALTGAAVMVSGLYLTS